MKNFKEKYETAEREYKEFSSQIENEIEEKINSINIDIELNKKEQRKKEDELYELKEKGRSLETSAQLIEKDYNNKKQDFFNKELKELEEYKRKMFKFFDIGFYSKVLKLIEFEESKEKYSRFAFPIKTKEYILENSHLVVAIGTNNKPVNKYSVVVYGSTIFDDIIGDKYMNSEVDVNLISNMYILTNVKFILKEFKTEEEAIDFLENKAEKTKQFYKVFKELQELEKEYAFFKKDIENDVYWNTIYYNDKKYYYEHRVSKGTEDEKYKFVCDKLEEFKK